MIITKHGFSMPASVTLESQLNNRGKFKLEPVTANEAAVVIEPLLDTRTLRRSRSFQSLQHQLAEFQVFSEYEGSLHYFVLSETGPQRRRM